MTMTTTNDAIEAALKAERRAADLAGYSPSGSTARRYEKAQANTDAVIADALAAVPAPTEADREAIADQVRRNCTPSTEAYKSGGDRLIYAVADWIENPPAWSSITPPVPAPTEADDLELHASLVNVDGDSEVHYIAAGRILAAGFHRTPVPALKTRDGEAREALVELIARATHPTDFWNEEAEYPTQQREDWEAGQLVARIDAEPVVDAILARYTLMPVTPEGGEPAESVFEAMGLPPLPPFPSIHPEGGETK